MIERIAGISPTTPKASAPRTDTSRDTRPFGEELAHARRTSPGSSGTTPARTDKTDSTGTDRSANHAQRAAHGRGGHAAQGTGRQDSAEPQSPSIAHPGKAAPHAGSIEGDKPARAAQDAENTADELPGAQSVAAQTLLDELRPARSDADTDPIEASGAEVAQEPAASPTSHAVPARGHLAHAELPTAPSAETSAIPATGTVLASADMRQEGDGDEAPHARPGRPALKAASAGAASPRPPTQADAPIAEPPAEQTAEIAATSSQSATQATGSYGLRQDTAPSTDGASRAVGTAPTFGDALSALSRHSVDVQSAQAPTAVHRPVLAEPLTSPAFAPAFASEVNRMVMLGTQTAELMLTPRSLGPIRIELSLSGETATVAFSAAQPETRMAIEQSLPMLRTLLEDRGIALGQANVGRGDEGGRESGTSASTEPGATADGRSGDSAGAGAGDTPALRFTPRSRGLVDLFA